MKKDEENFQIQHSEMVQITKMNPGKAWMNFGHFSCRMVGVRVLEMPK